VKTVTTEDDFQRALDARVTDWQTRLVFADWLQERGDPRADGYRALGMFRKYALKISTGVRLWLFGWDESNPNYGTAENKIHTYADSQLPDDWYVLITDGSRATKDHWERFDSRREAEDAAALAFGRLPAARRAELLATGPPS
jgi:uncharacterized protein (TIGR02996 family)